MSKTNDKQLFFKYARNFYASLNEKQDIPYFVKHRRELWEINYHLKY